MNQSTNDNHTQQILFCGDDGTTTDRFFFFATCPGIAERWRKEDEATPDGRVLRHLVVSLLIWLPEACIKLSGWCVRPCFRLVWCSVGVGWG